MLYQIIHTFEGFLNEPQLDGMTVLLGRNAEKFEGRNVEVLLEKRLEALKRGGIDGLVVNVGGIGYLESKEGWKLFQKGIRAAYEKGFRLWIYDEKGYPSGSAGGYVLKHHPEYEAAAVKQLILRAVDGEVSHAFPEKMIGKIYRTELRFDDESKNIVWKYSEETLLKDWEKNKKISYRENGLQEMVVYYTGSMYEWTHACNGYAESRRYINLLNRDAVKEFVRVTHDRYAEEIPEDIMENVEAFFTDEPSLMTVALNSLGGTATDKIPVLDPVDKKVPLLPVIPYSKELEDALVKEYGMQYENFVSELFSDKLLSEEKVRFWEIVSKVYERCFSETLQHGCAKHGKLLTGHILCEELPIPQVAYHGNPFRVLKHFDLPGVDLLSSHIEDFDIFGQKLPASVAWLVDREGIMSETSDFVQQRIVEKRPVTAEKMIKTLEMQYMIGVRTWSYYYDFTKRSMEEYAKANEVIKRMCQYGKDWKTDPEMILYCPYESLWAGYQPKTETQNELEESQEMSLVNISHKLRMQTKDMFYANYQFELCDESSIGTILEKHIPYVVLPAGKIISCELMNAAKEKKIQLYGETPKYYLEHGEIKAWDVNVSVIKGMPTKKEYPLEIEENLLLHTYKNCRFLVYNVTEMKKKMVLKMNAILYDPFKNQETLAGKGMEINIGAGQAIFVKGEE